MSEWFTGQTDIIPEIDGHNFSGEFLITGDLDALGFSLDDNFDFKLVIVDKLETVEKQTLLSAGSPAIDIYKNNISLGGMYDEHKGGRVQINGTPLVDYIYPVGSIYFSVENISPSTWLGGTWEIWGAGRVPVGVDVSQTEFNEAEKTGGEKTHRLSKLEIPHLGSGVAYEGTGIASGSGWGDTWLGGANEGENAAHNNLQPYITCYMWKRTA